MKFLFFLPLFFSSLLSAGQINTTWKYHKLIGTVQGDSINFFNADSIHNLYSLGKIRITFKQNNIYEALFFNGEKKEGTWKTENQQFIVDQDTNLIVTQTNNFMRTESDVVRTDMGYNLTGKIITELVRIPDCVVPESLRSGEWNDPTLWSCDRVPNKNDDVIINSGHTVTLSPQMGLHNCKSLTIKTGATFIENGKIYLDGN